MYNYYTYVLLDPTNSGVYTYDNYITFLYEPFYVGKGKNNRFKCHAWEALRNNKVSHKLNKIRKILKTTNPIILIISNNLLESDALLIEQYLIQIIGRKDLGNGPLTNLTDGGEKNTRHIFTEEQRHKMSISAKNKPPMSEITRQKLSELGKRKKGYICTEEQRERLGQISRDRQFSKEEKISIGIKISKKLKGKKKSPEHCANISKGRKGVEFSKEHRQNLSLSQKGKKKNYPKTEEARKNKSEALKKYYIEHPEAKENLSNKLSGRKLTEEHKLAISIGNKGKRKS